MALSKDQQQALFDCLADPFWRINNLYYIEDEQGNKVLFRLRPLQELFLRSIWYLNIILKARQLGFTTFIAIFILDRAVFNNNQRCGIIAHTKEDVIEIFRTKVKTPYESLPEEIRAAASAKADRTNELQFSNGSTIRVAVSMRSGTMQYLHVSEYGKLCAQYPKKAQEVKTGSFPTVHKDSFLFIESTAEGIGGDFYEKTMIAKEKQDRGAELGPMDFKLHFYPWYVDSKYELEPPSGYEFEPRIEEYFAELEALTGKSFSPAKRYWYAKKEEDQGEVLMKQEFPSTVMEAFVFSGRPAFCVKGLNKAEKDCVEPKMIADINPYTGELEERRDGRLLIWEMPQTDADYAVGADVAEGLEHGDHSSSDVLNEQGLQVAQWHGHADPDVFGRILNQLGRLYNNAFLGVERNNHGHATLQRLKDLNYPRLYFEEEIEERNEERKKKVGWLTNQKTKPFIIDNLKELIRDGDSGIRCKATVDECRIFIVDSRGRYGGQEGDKCFDDRVMSYAIAQEMLRRKPRKPRKKKLIRMKRDWRVS